MPLFASISFRASCELPIGEVDTFEIEEVSKDAATCLSMGTEEQVATGKERDGVGKTTEEVEPPAALDSDDEGTRIAFVRGGVGGGRNWEVEVVPDVITAGVMEDEDRAATDDNPPAKAYEDSRLSDGLYKRF